MSSTSSAAASITTTAAAASSSAVTKTLQASKNLKVVGIILAISSGLLIGSSFVFKKKGLLRSQAGGPAGEGVGYLKSPLWWTGMSMMILGEICNFAAYAFVEAIVVTPLGALSVVVCAILSSFFLNEKLSFFGWLGCGLCIIGSVIIALNGPHSETVGQIREFEKLFLAPGFLAYGSVLIVASLVIIIFFAPKYGKKSMLWYIFVCSMIGGISVSVTTGLGAAIVQSALGDNQFNYWFMYFLIIFVIVTLVTEVYYLNMALALYNTAMVTPTYYVIFTFFTMVTTIVLFKGLKASVPQILTIVMGFFVICLGITILQMSKVDPVSLSKLDRRSTILLQAARSNTETYEEKGAVGIEDPGMDALRGSFGTVGSIIRARSARRMSQSSGRPDYRIRPVGAGAPYDRESTLPAWQPGATSSPRMYSSPLQDDITRHQLYDAPVPRRDTASSIHGSPMVGKRPTIKFDSQDVVHQYDPPGTGDDRKTEHRRAVGSPAASGYPPLPAVPPRFSDGLPTHSDNTLDLLGLHDVSSNLGEASSSNRDSGSTHQTLELPSLRFANNSEVRSAPPTMDRRFAESGLPGRMQARDIYDKSPSTGTLLSFPSVTDSGRSEAWEDDDIVQGKDKRVQEKEQERSSKRYPRGAGDDDREESVSLWRRSGGDDDDDDNTSSPLADSPGGIRLVQPRVQNRF
ncbi:magnesium transporter NIPA-domain-containing protein [Collybia nuda]|uniref:Magnesium transporter NIPA-domain-containing protein n=1 Tax=Collybia nuda TaxID=64659 RepID=A0A9P5XUG5_9AGAR|nr:magnesium transporter NIPA-domain-containing protein [Collybia nuda]